MKRALCLILLIALQPILSVWSDFACRGEMGVGCCADAAACSSCTTPAEPANSESPTTLSCGGCAETDEPPPSPSSCCAGEAASSQPACAAEAPSSAASCAAPPCDILKDPLCTLCFALCRAMCEQPPIHTITPGPKSAPPRPTALCSLLPLPRAWPIPSDISPRADAHPARALSPPERRALLCIRTI